MSKCIDADINMVMYCLNINCKEETSPQQKMKLLSPPSVHIIYKYSEWAKPLQCNTCHVIRYMCNICAWTCVGQRTCNSYVRSRFARHHKWHNLANKTISSKNKRSATDVASLGSLPPDLYLQLQPFFAQSKWEIWKKNNLLWL